MAQHEAVLGELALDRRDRPGDAGVGEGRKPTRGSAVVDVCPGAVATPINRSTLDDPAELEQLQGAIPLGPGAT